jgi:SAM-dependent methyltransferase
VSRGTYAFGDSAAARERLALVSRVFDPCSRAFLASATASPPALAVDLGCGPGATTALVHAATGARHTVGLDQSAAFLAAARGRVTTPGVEFRRHDVTQTPFPVGPADLLYARLLVAHLARPAEVVARWLTQLTAGGRLALDEVEWIRTEEPVLEGYLGIAVALIAAHGGDMFAGPRLAALGLDGEAVALRSEVAVLPVPVAQAARMFRLNLGVWGSDPWVAERYGAETVDRLGVQLDALRAAPREAVITWGMRQLVLTRVAPRLLESRRILD